MVLRRSLLGLCFCFTAAACADEVETRTTQLPLEEKSTFTSSEIENLGSTLQSRTFDVRDGMVEATVLRLGNVQIDVDGTLDAFPTPSHDATTDLPTPQAWSVSITPAHLGRGDDLKPLSRRNTQRKDARVSTTFDRLVQHYDHVHHGLAQSFDIEKRLVGTSELILGFDTSTNLNWSLENDGRDLVGRGFKTEHFSLRGLKVLDANEVELPARFVVTDNGYEVRIDDRKAAYPILVDPLASTPNTSLFGAQDNGQFGFEVTGVGDINDDNFDDVFVGEPQFTNGQDSEGRGLVFPGSAAGVSATAIWAVEGGTAFANFGTTGLGLGDVDGDGVGGDYFAVAGVFGGGIFQGEVRVYQGVSTIHGFAVAGDQGAEAFGEALTAGDYNCDGDIDLAISAHLWDDVVAGGTNHGRVLVYFGSGTIALFNSTPTQIDRVTGATSFFGSDIATGNIDGDAANCDDLIVGASRWSSRRGRLDAYHGSPTGLSVTPDWTVLGTATKSGSFGFAIDSGTDLDGDGRDEVLAGAYLESTTLTKEGKAGIWSPPSTTVQWNVFGDDNDAFFGVDVAFAGDVDGNGSEDVLVGASDATIAVAKEGVVYLYLTPAPGMPSTTAGWIENQGADSGSKFGFTVDAAGDVNNDNLADVVIGGHFVDNVGGVKTGGAFVYHGAQTCVIMGVTFLEGVANPANPCESCNTAVSTTAFTTRANGSTCSDGEPCTTADTCNAGVCSGAPVVCNDNLECTSNTCVPGLGCTFETAPVDGNDCTDDGLSCTTDVCAAGVCVHNIAATTCLINGTCYEDGDALGTAPCEQCIPANDNTTFTAAQTGESCDDGAFCTENTVCDAGLNCSGGTPTDCSSAATECTQDVSCDEATDQCQPINPVPDGVICSNGDLCVPGACSFGVCLPGAPVDCSAFDTECTDGSCDPGTGNCFGIVKPDNTVCDDNNLCTNGDTCVAGACIAGPALPCDDNQSCTDDSCDPAVGCQFAAVAPNTACEQDGVSCTDGTCINGGCVEFVASGACQIDNMCLLDGAVNPVNECERCDSLGSPTMWADIPDGTTCGAMACNGNATGVLESTCILGGCSQPVTRDCGAYICDVNVTDCFTECTSDAQCEAGALCTGSVAVPGECITERPTAVANGPAVATCGETVTLDGSGSFDPNNLPLTYAWTQTEGPDVLQGVIVDEQQLTITLPADGTLDMDTTFRFELVASNPAFDSDPSQILLVVQACPEEMDNDDVGTSDAGDAGDAGDTSNDVSTDGTNDTALDANDGGADLGADTNTGDVDLVGSVQGSGCLCASSSPTPTDLSWLLLLVGFVARRRRRR